MDTLLKLFNLDDGFDLFEMVFMGIWQAGFAMGGAIFAGIGLIILLDFFNWRTSPNKYRTQGDIIGVHVSGMEKEEIVEGIKEDIEKHLNVSSEEIQNAKSTAGPIVSFFGSGLALIFVLMILAIPFIFFGFGAYSAYSYYDLKNNGIQTTGHVVDYKRHYDSDSGTTYNAVFAYNDHYNQTWREEDRIGNSRKAFSIGEQLPIYYQKDDPKNFAVADYWHNMLTPMVFIGVSTIIMFFLFGGGHWLADSFKRENNYTSAPQKNRQKANFANEMYYEVIEYVTDRGERVRAMTNSGSSSLLSKMPGSRIPIIADKDNPTEVRRVTTLWLWLGLIVFIAPSSLMFYIAFNEGISPVFFLVISYFALTKGSKLYKIWREYADLSPEEKADKKQSFMIRRADKKDAKGQLPLLDKFGVQDRLRYYRAQARISSFILFIMGSAALYGGYVIETEFLKELWSMGQGDPKSLIGYDWTKAKEEEIVSLIICGVGAFLLFICTTTYLSSRNKRY